MKTGSWQANIAALLVAAGCSLPSAAGAQNALTPTAGGFDLPQMGGECVDDRVGSLPEPGACGQIPGPLPTWAGPLPDPTRTERMRREEWAAEMARRLHSRAVLDRWETEKERLQREVFADVLRDIPETPGAHSTASGQLPSMERIYLFISESIPLETLRNYTRDIAELRDPRMIMVLRGFIGGMRHVLPTRRFILDVLRKDPVCDPATQPDCEVYAVNAVIDPLLFRRYGVQEVPAVVYVQERPGNTPLPDGSDDPTENVWRISGDASFAYLLSRIQEAAKSTALETILERVRIPSETRH